MRGGEDINSNFVKPNKGAKVIFLIGPPASGKSYVANLLLQNFGQKVKCLYLDDRVILKQLCAKDENSEKWRYLKEDSGKKGKWEIIDITIHKDQLRELNEIAIQNFFNYQYIIIEFTNPDWIKAFSFFNQSLFRSSYVILLKINMKTALKRNRERGEKYPELFVPERYIKKFFTKREMKIPAKLFKYIFYIEAEQSKTLINKYIEKMLNTYIYDK